MSDWTDDKKDRLRTLWTQGLPTRAIAADLGTTNGAVAGQARRLALPFRSGPRAAAGHSAFSKREAKKRRAAKKDNPFGSSKVFERQFAKIEARMLAADSGRIGIPILIKRDGLLHANERLGLRDCKWPIDGGFCGRSAIAGVSYCESHLRRATGGPLRIPASAIPIQKTGHQLLLFPDILEPIARKLEVAA